MVRDYDYDSFSSRLAGVGRSGVASGGGGGGMSGVEGFGRKEKGEEGVVPHITGSRGVTSMTVPKGYTPPRMSVMERLQMPFDASSSLDSHSESHLYSRSRAQSDKGTDTPEKSKATIDKEKEREKEKSERWVPGPTSRALERSVRALENVQRIGKLQTLDLKGNDIRVSFHLIYSLRFPVFQTKTKNFDILTSAVFVLVGRRDIHCPSFKA